MNYLGDCLDVLRTLPDNSVDSIVTDPPYGLSFMGKRWDYDVPSVEIWAECLRVLKPGGHLLAFAGTRTQHRMAVRIEDAGFEIRDMIAWVYGSGFPKSLDVSKAIDKKHNEAPVFDAIRAHIREWRDRKGFDNRALNEAVGSATTGCGMARHWTSGGGGQHAIPSKEQWRKLKELLGWPDCEFDAIYQAVKDGASRPVVGRGTADALAWYAQREASEGYDITAPATEAARQWEGWGTALKPALEPITVARKPLAGTVAANTLAHGTGALNIDACRVESDDSWSYPEGPGGCGGGEFHYANRANTPAQSNPLGRWPANLIHDGSGEVADVFGDPARFFYCAKASKRDREDGNNHPTVKPTDLMRYLCRLVTPKGGTVLDPFMGSGSTGRGAVLEGFEFIGIEREPEYLLIAEARIAAAVESLGVPASAKGKPKPSDEAQVDMFGAAAA